MTYLSKLGFKDKDAWLYSRGGRDISDVGTDEKGDYIVMGGRSGRLKKVYLPTMYPHFEVETDF